VLLIVLRIRRPKPIAATVPSAAPIEDTLAALEGAWQDVSVPNRHATITTMAAILRRYLSRRWAVDVTSSTTRELQEVFSRPPSPSLAATETFLSFRRDFFEPADWLRFAGETAAEEEARRLYEAARDFVQHCESKVSAPVTPSSSGMGFTPTTMQAEGSNQ
jgi:hypothetical protein